MMLNLICHNRLCMFHAAVEGCKTGEVRLVGGVTNSTGRLEVCAYGMWGRVCNRFQYWGPDNAQVVCRQLGFSEIGTNVLLCVKKNTFP